MPLEPADAPCLPHIVAIAAACVAHMRSGGNDQWDETYPSADVFEKDCSAGNLYVLRGPDSRPIACGTLDDRQAPEYAGVPWLWATGPVGVVHRLMVSPPQMGRGLAKTVMLGLEDVARLRGCMAIRLDCFLKNAVALRLYASLGYLRSGTVTFRRGEFACFEKLLPGVTFAHSTP